MVHHFPMHGMQRILDSVGHMGMADVMERDIPHEHTEVLSLDGGKNS
jgi:hypothetical protein